MYEYKVVGYEKGITKRGTLFTVLHLIGDFDNYKKSKGALGQSVNTVYVSKDLNVNVSDEIQLVYGVGYEGKAIVIDIVK